MEIIRFFVEVVILVMSIAQLQHMTVVEPFRIDIMNGWDFVVPRMRRSIQT